MVKRKPKGKNVVSILIAEKDLKQLDYACELYGIHNRSEFIGNAIEYFFRHFFENRIISEVDSILLVQELINIYNVNGKNSADFKDLSNKLEKIQLYLSETYELTTEQKDKIADGVKENQLRNSLGLPIVDSKLNFKTSSDAKIDHLIIEEEYD